MVPILPAPPCTSSTSSAASLAWPNTLALTVHATSGSAAASVRLTPSGIGSNRPAGTATSSA
jgi:hypothetical protein